jgi:hypothetical protein
MIMLARLSGHLVSCLLHDARGSHCSKSFTHLCSSLLDVDYTRWAALCCACWLAGLLHS